MRHLSPDDWFTAAAARLRRVQPHRIRGTVTRVLGLVAEVQGLTGLAGVGDRLELHGRDGRLVPVEVIGFRDTVLQTMACMRASSSALSYGLVMKSSAPRLSALTLACGMVIPERTTTGVSLRAMRMRRTTSNPSISGRVRSSSTMSYS